MVKVAQAEAELIVTGQGKFKSELKNAEGNVKDFESSIKGLSLASIAGFSVAGFAVGSFVRDATSKALEFSQTFRGFTNLVEGDANSFLNALNEAAGGTVSNLELVRNANQAILLGIKQEQLPELLEAARLLGAAVGRTTAEAFGDLALGIGRQSKLILDNLGLIVKAEEAYQGYADSVHKAVSELTEQEKSLAFNQAVMEAVREKTSQLGGVVDENAEAVAQAKKEWEDFKTVLGEDFLITIGGTIRGLRELRQEAHVSLTRMGIPGFESIEEQKARTQGYMTKGPQMSLDPESKTILMSIANSSNLIAKNTLIMAEESGNFTFERGKKISDLTDEERTKIIEQRRKGIFLS